MKRITGLLVLFFGFQAHAGFMVEPFVGYSMGSGKTTSVGGSDASTSDSGMAYGARLGFRFSNGFSLAGEYAGGSGKSKDTTSGSTATDSDYVHTGMGVVLGFDRGMWRVYGGYGLSESYKVKSNTAGGSDTTYTGTSYKVGVGVMPARHFAVNLEYSIPKFTKIKNDALSAAGASDTLSDYFSKFDEPVTTLTLSFPFDFGGK